ncbi:hypothetical protein DYB37_014090 [Aphanomyces astaci]|uniref:Tc1-like transposase DDE domain-containing protein n=1 Tax=Aphanomyces astaci TaxID=112090 RepID=A0A3R7EPN1_APHAT|nr:hypothetical protein DYB37_014090 [Aphanomyces astaci]
MFVHAYFVKWFGKCMDEVEKLEKQGVTVVIDNAKYHKGQPADTPRGMWRKADLLTACLRFNVDVESVDLKKTIWARLKPVVAAKVLPVVVIMALSRGRDVVYTPPHHSDLQPIEMVWSKVKGDFGVQYFVDTTFADVQSRLAVAFDALPPAVIWNCVRHWDKLLQDMYQLLLTREENEDEGSSSDESSDAAVRVIQSSKPLESLCFHKWICVNRVDLIRLGKPCL